MTSFQQELTQPSDQDGDGTFATDSKQGQGIMYDDPRGSYVVAAAALRLG